MAPTDEQRLKQQAGKNLSRQTWQPIQLFNDEKGYCVPFNAETQFLSADFETLKIEYVIDGSAKFGIESDNGLVIRIKANSVDRFEKAMGKYLKVTNNLNSGELPVPDVDVAAEKKIAGLTVGVSEEKGERELQEDAFLAEEAPNIPSKDRKQYLKDRIADAEAATTPDKELRGGATVGLTMISPDRWIDVAFLGDSPAMVFTRHKQTGEVQGTLLTRDHSTSDPKEVEKAVKERGAVSHTFPSGQTRLRSPDGKYINMTRSLGDYEFGYNKEKQIAAVSKEPEYRSFALDAFGDKDTHEFFVVAGCDGLLRNGKMQPADLTERLSLSLKAGFSPGAISEALTRFALLRGSNDNVTALVIPIPEKMEGAIIVGVLDGHGGPEVAQAGKEALVESIRKTRGVAKDTQEPDFVRIPKSPAPEPEKAIPQKGVPASNPEIVARAESDISSKPQTKR